ncbi:hemagglutinin repeat-containing protein [Marinibactrum halimedae]|uniref:Filamentous haemagglutinin FhaB/tRNA nuclease CdiA-like TPS domain-containing protein n=1 Tax=Marinibactrum halimedae TaxID=1444977 RepID=A0AA37T296_9GAMM|nr:hemagglutinin repeat-containing protein [Marinibactrum halimedae]MCD9460995.1 hemagglutinin repeat-containing protein [Marinibactrum halimedae]GLS24774.1 hypothetical protein GCM10007877_04880 [Marinibactrum halimedae]
MFSPINRARIARVLLFVMWANPLLSAAQSFTAPQQNTSVGIEVDANAASNQRARIRESQNGTVVVDIAEVSRAGVSHNRFREFNVSDQGLILNNSVGPTLTNLGGWVDGNRHLAGGQADIILAEVTGANVSTLLGLTEIAGQSAEFVLANPNGITCNGCGFINTPRAVFATGVPDVRDGQLYGFNIAQGSVFFDGQGLNASNITKFDVYTRALQLNANVYANELNIVTGDNYIDYQTGTVSGASNLNTNTEFQFALDASALGAMYANNITLVGTEAGLGVRSEGLINSVNDLELTANGEIRLKDTIAGNEATLTAQNNNVTTTGTTYAQNVTIESGGTYHNENLLGALNQLTVNAAAVSQLGEVYAGLDSDGRLLNQGTMNLNVQNGLENQGVIYGNRASVTAGQFMNMGTWVADELIANASAFTSSGAIQGRNLQIESDQFTLDNGSFQQLGEGNLLIATNTFNINDAFLASQGAATLNATEFFRNAGSVLSEGSISIQAPEIENVGVIQTLDAARLQGNRIANSGALIFDGVMAPELIISELNNASGTLQIAADHAQLDIASLNNDDGHIVHVGASSLALSGETISNNDGQILSNGAVAVSSSNTIENRVGTMAGQRLSMVARSLDNQAGTLVAQSAGTESLVVDIENQLDNDQGVMASEGDALVSAASLNHGGGVLSGDNLSLTTEALSITDGSVIAGNNLVVQSSTVDNLQGQLLAVNAMNVDADSLLNGGQIQASSIDLSVAQLTNSANAIVQGENLAITASTVNNAGNLVATGTVGESLQLTTATVNNQGVIESAGEQLRLSGLALNNQGGAVHYRGEGVLRLEVLQGLDNRGGSITSQGGLILNHNEVANEGGQLASLGVMSITAEAVRNEGGLIQGGEGVSLSATSLFNQSGAVVAESGVSSELNIVERIVNTQGNIVLAGATNSVDTASLENTEGAIEIAGQGRIATGVLQNRDGAIALTGSEASSLTVAAQLDNQSGEILTNSQLFTLSSDSINNTQGALRAAGAVSVLANTLNNQQGQMLAGSFNIEAVSLDNQRGELGAVNANGNGLSLTLSEQVDNQFGQIYSASIALLQADSLDNSHGELRFDNDAHLVVNTLNNFADGQIVGQGQVRVDSVTLRNDGVISADQLAIETDSLTNSGHIESQSSQTLRSQILENTGVLRAENGDLSVASALLSNVGTIVVAGAGVLSLEAQQALQNQAGQILSNDALQISAQQLNNQQGVIQAALGAEIDAHTVNNNSGDIRSGQVRLNAHSFSNVAGSVMGEAATGNSLSLSIAEVLDNTQGQILIAGDSGEINTGQLLNNDGLIEGGADAAVSITATSIQNQAGSLSSQRVLDLQTQSLDTSGVIQAQQLQIQADQLTNSGEVRADNTVNLAASSLNNSGIVRGDEVALSAQTLVNTGQVVADGLQANSLMLTTGHIENRGTLASYGENLQLAQTTFDNNSGQLFLFGEGVLQLDILNTLRNQGGEIVSQGVLAILAGQIDNTLGGRIAANDQVRLTAEEWVNGGQLTSGADATVTVGRFRNLVDGLFNAGHASVTTETLENQGQLVVQGDLTLNSTMIDNDGGLIQSEGVASIQAQNLSNQAGQLLLTGTDTSAIAVTAQLNNRNGEIASNGAVLDLSAGQLDNTNGTVSALHQINITTDGLTNHRGAITANTAVINAVTLDNQQAGRIESESLSINSNQLTTDGQLRAAELIIAATELAQLAAGELNANQLSLNTTTLSNAGQIILGEGDIRADGLSNTGSIATQNHLAIDSTSLMNSGSVVAEVLSIHAETLNNSGGSLAAVDRAQTSSIQNSLADRDRLTISSTSLDNQNGRIALLGAGVLRLDVLQALSNQNGQIVREGADLSAARAELNVGELDNTSGAVAIAGALSVSATEVRNLQNGLISAEQFQLQAQNLDNTGGVLESEGAMSVSAAQLLNQGGVVVAGGGSAVESTLTLAISQQIDNRQGTVLQQGSGPLSLTGTGFLDNQGGSIASTHDLVIDLMGQQAGVGVNNQGGTLQAQGSINLTTANRLRNDQGALESGAAMVVNAGSMSNTDGQVLSSTDMALTLQAALDSSGVIATENGNLTIDTTSLDNRGVLLQRGVGELAIQADQIANAGEIGANTVLSLTANTLTNSGLVDSSNVTLSTFNALNSGTLVGDVLSLTAQALNNQNGVLASRSTVGESLQLNVASTLNNQNGVIQSRGSDLQLGAVDNRNGSVLLLGDGSLSAGELNNADGVVVSQGGLSLTGATFNQRGRIQAANDVHLGGSVLDNTSGTFTSGGAMQVDVATLTNTGGTLSAMQWLSAVTDQLNNTNGRIESGEVVTLTASGDMVNNNGVMVANDQVSLSASNVNNRGGQVRSGIVSLSANALDNSAGGRVSATDSAANSLNLSGVVSINNAAGTLVSSAQDWTLATTNLNNTGGTIAHQGNGTLTLNTQTAFTNNGNVSSTGSLAITSSAVDNGGRLEAGSQLTLNGGVTNRAAGVVVANAVDINAANQTVTNQGRMVARNVLEVSAATIVNDLLLFGTNKATLEAQTLDNNATLSSADLDIVGFTTLHNSGRIEAANGNFSGNQFLNEGTGQVVLTGPSSTFGAAQFTNQGSLTSNSADLSFGGHFTNNGSLVHSGNGTLTLGNNGQVDVSGGTVATAGQAALHGGIQGAGSVFAQKGIVLNSAGTFTNSGSRLYTQGNLAINSALNNTNGSIIADGTLAINTQGVINNSYGVLQGDQLALSAGSINNTNGTITSLAGGNGSVQAASINNTGGVIQSENTNFSVRATNGDFTNTDGTIRHSSTGTLTVVGSRLLNENGTVDTKGALSVSTTGLLDNDNGTLRGTQFTVRSGDLSNVSGTIEGTGGGNSSLQVAALTNTGGLIHGDGANLNIAATTLNNRDGAMFHSGTGTFTVNASSINSDGAGSQIRSNGALTLNGGNSLHLAGTVSGQGRVTLNANGIRNQGLVGSRANVVDIDTSGTFNNSNGVVSGATGAQVDVNRVINTGGRLQSNGTVAINTAAFDGVNQVNGSNVNLTVRNGLTLNTTDAISAANNITINTQANDFTNHGQVVATGNITTHNRNVTNSGALRGGNTVTLNANNLTNTGTLSSNQLLRLNVGNTHNQRTVAANELDINGTVTNSDLLFARTNMTIDGSVTNTGSIHSQRNATLTGGTINNNGGRISAVRDLSLSGTINNNRVGGSVTYSQVGVPEVEEGPVIPLREVLNGQQIAVEQSIQFERLTRTEYHAEGTGLSGVIASGNNLTLNGRITNDFSTISSGGVLNISGEGITNNVAQSRVVERKEEVVEHQDLNCTMADQRTGECVGGDFETYRTETTLISENTTYTGGGAFGTIASAGGITGNLSGQIVVNDLAPESIQNMSQNTSVSGNAGTASRGAATSGINNSTASVSQTYGSSLAVASGNRTASHNVTAGTATSGGSAVFGGVTAANDQGKELAGFTPYQVGLSGIKQRSLQGNQARLDASNGLDGANNGAVSATDRVWSTVKLGEEFDTSGSGGLNPTYLPAGPVKPRFDTGVITAVNDPSFQSPSVSTINDSDWRSASQNGASDANIDPSTIGVNTVFSNAQADADILGQQDALSETSLSQVTNPVDGGLSTLAAAGFEGFSIDGLLVGSQAPEFNYGAGNGEDYAAARAAFGADADLLSNGHNPELIIRDLLINNQVLEQQRQVSEAQAALQAQMEAVAQALGIEASEVTEADLLAFATAPLTDEAPLQFTPDNTLALLNGNEVAPNIFLSDAHIRTLTADFGFDGETLQSGTDTLYAALRQNDLLEAGVSIGTAGNMDLTAEGGFQLESGLSAGGTLRLATDAELGLTHTTLFDTGLLHLDLGGDFTNEYGLSSDNILLEVDGDFINNNTLNASNISIFAQDITNNSFALASDALWLEAENNLINTGGARLQGDRVSLTAGNDLINRTESERVQFEREFRQRIRVGQHSVSEVQSGVEFYTQVGPAAEILSGTNLTIDAGRDIDLTGTELAASDSVSISAGRDLLFGAIEIATGTERYGKRGYDIRYDTTFDVASVTTGGDLSITAGNDLTTAGTLFAAGQDINLAAGGEMNLLGVSEYHESRRKRKKKSTFKKKVKIDETISVIHHGTTLVAGGDVGLNADRTDDGLQLFNSGDVTMVGTEVSAGGDFDAYSGGDLNVVSGEEYNHEFHYKKKSYAGGLFGSSRTSEVQVEYLGHTEINTGGDTTLLSHNDINVLAGHINADNISAVAGFGNEEEKAADVNILGDEQTQSLYSERRRNGLGLDVSGDMLSVAKETAKENRQVTTDYVGSILNATDNISVQASRDANIVGSGLNAGGDIRIEAERDVNLLAGQSRHSTMSRSEETNTGIAVSADGNNASVFAGDDIASLRNTTTGVTAAAATLTAEGNISVNAGNDILQIGSDVLAEADVQYSADNDINILSFTEEVSTEQKERHTRDGFTFTANYNLENTWDTISNLGQGDNAVSNASGAMRAMDALNNTGPSIKVHVGRTTTETRSRDTFGQARGSFVGGDNVTFEAGGDANVAGSNLGAKNDITIDAENINILAVSNTTDSDMRTRYRQDGFTLNASQSNVNIMGGFSQSASDLNTRSTTAIGSGLSASNLHLNAREDLTVTGSTLNADNNASLAAGESIIIEAAQDASSSRSEDSHLSAAAGVNFGSDGIGVKASFAMGEGELDRDGIHYTNGQITAGNNLSITSGGDTTVAGANLHGGEVNMDVGGDLTVASVQDTGEVEGSRWDVSLGVTAGAGVSVNGSVGYGETEGSKAWVNEQTGITGERVNINVGGHTQIDGAVIAAVDEGEDGQLQDNGNLTLSTGTLGFSDIQDHDKEESYYLGVSFGFGGDNPDTNAEEGSSSWGVDGNYYERDRKQINRATVGNGTIAVRDDTNVDLSGLNRDIDTAQEITRDKEENIDIYASSTAWESTKNLAGVGEMTATEQLNEWKDNVGSVFSPKSWGEVLINAFDATRDLANAGKSVSNEDNLSGVGGFFRALDTKHKARLVQHELSRTPYGQELLRRFQEGDQEERLQVQSEIGQLLEQRLGITEASEVNFYDGDQTESTSLQDTAVAGTFGATVVDESSEHYGEMYINVTNAEDHSDLANTIGHEVNERATLLNGEDNNAQQEALSNVLGEQHAYNLNELMDGGLSSRDLEGAQNTDIARAGTERSHGVGNARVDYRQVNRYEMGMFQAGRDAIANSSLTQEEKNEQQVRLDALNCAAIRCAAGIPEDDPRYNYRIALQRRGEAIQQEEGTDVVQMLEGLGVSTKRYQEVSVDKGPYAGTYQRGEKQEFEYSGMDAAQDWASANTDGFATTVNNLAEGVTKEAAALTIAPLLDLKDGDAGFGFTRELLGQAVEHGDVAVNYESEVGQRVENAENPATFEEAPNYLLNAGLAAVEVAPGVKVAKDAAVTAVETTGDVLRQLGKRGDGAEGNLVNDLSQGEADDFYNDVSQGNSGPLIDYKDLSDNTNIAPEVLESVVQTPKGQRPDPSTYFPDGQVDEHLTDFEEGVTKFVTEGNYKKYGIAQRDGTSFVLPKGEGDNLLNAANGDPRALESALGLPDNFLEGNTLLRVDVSNPKELNLRVPSGNEAGTNSQWLPGGKLPDGNREAIIDAQDIPPENISVKELEFGGKETPPEIRYNNPNKHKRDLSQQAGLPDNIDMDNPSNAYGLDSQQLRTHFEQKGYDVKSTPTRASSSGNAQIIELKDHHELSKVQYSRSTAGKPRSERSQHVGEYTKFTFKPGKADAYGNKKVYVIDPETFKGTAKNSTFYDTSGRRLEFKNGRYEVVK